MPSNYQKAKSAVNKALNQVEEIWTPFNSPNAELMQHAHDTIQRISALYHVPRSVLLKQCVWTPERKFKRGVKGI